MQHLFIRACRGQQVERTPLWLMRQAGRYLPEYRELRKQHDFLTLVRTPELATKVTLQPIERFGFDAAILFSDIMIPALALGLHFDFSPGPVMERPVRSADDVARLQPSDVAETVPFVFETVRMVRRELDGRTPLIGFAAAPFSLAVYLIEGRGTKQFTAARSMFYTAPDTVHTLLDRITDVTIRYLLAQIEAGAQAVQLFDSWVGLLDDHGFATFGLPYVQRVLGALAETGVPRIYFGLNASHLYHHIANCQAEVISVDWRTPLDRAALALGGSFALQGNLDPCALMADPETVRQRAGEILGLARTLPGHIFNLGHGIFPGTPLESVEALVETVQRGQAGLSED